MSTFLIRRLEQFSKLSADDKDVLRVAAAQRVRRVAPREDIVHEGDKPRGVSVFLDGWACRYKTLEDGRRQIIAYFVPGDMGDLYSFVLREMDHSIAALTPLTVAEFSRDTLDEMTARSPRIGQAFWWETLVFASIQREWTVSLGLRSALERISHLLCELFFRLRAVGLADNDTCELPVTQVDLGETVGLSSVHVNRTLQELRASGLITLRDRTLIIHDLDALQTLALFNPSYLHLGSQEGGRPSRAG